MKKSKFALLLSILAISLLAWTVPIGQASTSPLIDAGATTSVHSLADIPTGTSYKLYEYHGYTWVDAEKRLDSDGGGIGPDPGEDDDLLCWAATASNVLEWTGWGLVGGMWDTDAIFDSHKGIWNDTGGYIHESWRWWLNGIDPSPLAPRKLVPGGANYWPGVTWTDYFHEETDNAKCMHAIDDWLRAGYGVGIFIGGHCITIWGFNYDPTVDKSTNPHDYYLGIWVTDSDSHKNSPPYPPPPYAPGREYPNRLSYYEVEWNGTGNYWYTPNYGPHNIRWIQALEPYPSGRPVADADGPYTVNEGSAITFDGSGSSDADGDPLQYRWDFDNDGVWDTAWSAMATASNTWYDDYDGTVVLQVYANQLLDIDTTTVTVNNVAPTVDAGPDQTADEGDTVNFSGSFTDPGTDDIHTVEWDFGDGTTTTGTLTPTHVYGDNGVYTVTLTVIDDDGGVGTDTLIVTVNNVAPSIAEIAMTPPNPDNPEYILPTVHEPLFTAPATDPGSDDLTFTWNWDDGTDDTTIYYNDGVGPDPYPSPDGTYPFSATDDVGHIYSDPGTYTVTLTVEDDDGGVDTATYEITILSAEEAKHVINDYIQGLPDDAFKNNPRQRKKAFNNMFTAIDDMLADEEYNGTINDLQCNIRDKADGTVDGSPKNDWITDPAAQAHICWKIDELIAYLETLI